MPNQPSLRLLFGFVLLCLVALLPLQAQTPGLGSLTGHVSDVSSHLPLVNARVAINDTKLETFTNAQGDYRFAAVPAGAVTLTVSYVGYQPLTVHGDLAAGQSLKLDAQFGEEVVTMSEYRISGQVIGTARAINSQRAAPALTSVVASDAVGQLPDKNLAEALQRVPGVETVRDKGEGRFINIRGMDQLYNGVSMNGIRMSTAEKGTRQLELDVISSSFISSIEVNKVNTPDMDTDDMGGSVNIKTRSGFDQDGRQLMLQLATNYAHQEDKHGGYNAAINYADQLADGKLGVAFDVAAESRPFTTYTEPGTTWSLVKSPTDGQNHWVLNSQDFRHYDARRWRQGISTGFDYKIAPGETAYVRVLDSSYLEANQQWLTTFPFGAGTLSALTDTTATTSIKAGGILKSLTQIKNNKRESSSVAGLDSKVGDFSNNFEMGYTTGKYTRPQVGIVYATTAATVVSYGFNGPYNNTVQQISGPSIDSPASYVFNSKSAYSDTSSSMHEVSAKDDLRYDLPNTPQPEFIKVGVEYRDKNNTFDTSNWKISSVPYSSLASIIYPGEDTQYTWGGFPNFQIRQEAVSAFYANQSQFPTVLNVATTYGGAFSSYEHIGSLYGEYGITLGKLKLTFGARDEDTDFFMKGWQYDATTAVVTPTSGKKNYNELLPAVIGEIELTSNDIARFSWTNTLSRPDYAATTPGRSVDDNAHTVSQGNINLAPLKAMNWDASYEHYYSPLGMVSAAFFYKSISNFTYQAQSGTDPATGYLLTTYFNGPSAWIYGLELNWVQQLRFLPGPLSGLGLNASLITGTSEAHYPTRPGESIPFTGFGHEFGNVAVTYSYMGWNARVAESFHGRRLEANSTIGTDATQDQYEEPFVTLDASISYSFWKHWQVYFQGSNLNNAPLKEYYGGTPGLHRIQTYEAYGWIAESGIRWTY